MHLRLRFATISLLSVFSAFGQTGTPVFPDLQGQELLDSLVAAYKPVISLDFARARDTLFSKVYGHNDSLTCVYTGYTIYLDPTKDPTIDAFDKAINTEHTFPQSKGAETGPPRSDMHHLYPTREDVNAARGDFPFVELSDAQTKEWYSSPLGHLTSPPPANADLYSKVGAFVFEPREDHKGNVARAMFYFYTMYRQQADLADNSYFPAQRATLCQWHLTDPADQLEWERTWKIASYQSGKPNPFVLDCTLPARTYCPEIIQEQCVVVSTRDFDVRPAALYPVFPNPAKGQVKFLYELNTDARVKLTVSDLTGKLFRTLINEKKPEGKYQTAANLPAGMWTASLLVEKNGKIWQETMRFIVID
ncbi:MAG TPA: endonuclease [Flavilitoribacter sp.]|nr:endonuclease [Flavilitoribacter sp.]